jgi:hypothetical protein
MKDADSPGDDQAAGQTMPQLPEVKPFTLGKSSKKSTLPRIESQDEGISAPPPKTLTMLPNALMMNSSAPTAERGHDSVFTSLVRADGDIIGLVAYSIHKQNEHDWVLAFTNANDRAPDAAETAAFLLGEATPRRLATYRHLAAATLAGKGPEVPTGDQGDSYAPSGDFAAARYLPSRPQTQSPTNRGATVFAYIGLAVVFVVAVLLAAHYGLPGISGH